ncbi:MAG TPA: ATP-binding protein [Candidatus Limnocylindrales bacterium]|nr:ATP-binding protein [Candidatus Limnocylindrales bacterium]
MTLPTPADPTSPSGLTPAELEERLLEPADRGGPFRFDLPFRTRVTVALVAAAILPLAGFGLLVVISTALGGQPVDSTFGRLLVFAIAVGAVFGILLAYLLVADLTGPLRAIGRAVERVSAGDLGAPIELPGDDELARLAESHNRLAADLERRNRELGRILAAMETTSPRDGVDWLVGRAAADAREAFGLIEARLELVDPATIPVEEVVPGDPRPVRAILRAGSEKMGVLVGRLPATRRWEHADQDLLELFTAEIAIAIRNAQLFAQVEAQNAQLLELDAAKDDFLRGVSHNLQTPLARIRAYADQLDGDQPDRRLGIIAEQTDRLSRMVRQLLTVTRLESGALRPQPDVLALATRVRRAWEALGSSEAPFALDDRSDGWLAVADADQLDQVLWALLDNAVKYGGRSAIEATISVDPHSQRLRATFADHGPGVPDADRGRLFGRFERGSEERPDEGSGLGLYVSRELCRAMGGDLILEPAAPDRGAAFTIVLPAEPPEA